MFQEEVIQKPYLKIHPDDNVLVALRDLRAGDSIVIEGQQIEIRQDVAAKHKFFIDDLHPGDSVIMYGTLVGKVQVPVVKGGLMTTSNTKHAAGNYSYRGFKYQWREPDLSKFRNRT